MRYNKNRNGKDQLKALFLMITGSLALTSAGLGCKVISYAAEALDWESYANSDEYIVRVGGGSTQGEEYKAYIDVHEETMGAGAYVFRAYDKETGKEVVSQELWYKMEDAEMMKIIPFDTAFPDISVDVIKGRNDWGEHVNDLRRGEGEASCVFRDPYPLKDGGYSKSDSTINGCKWRLAYDGGIGATWNLLENQEEELIGQAEKNMLEIIPDDIYNSDRTDDYTEYDVHSDVYGITNGRVVGRYASMADDYLEVYPNQDVHTEQFRAEYLIYRKLPDVPFLLFECFVYYHGDLSRYKTHTSRLIERPEADEIMETFHMLRKQIEEMCVRDVSSTPIQYEWQEPVWSTAIAETIDSGSPVEDTYENPRDTSDIPPDDTAGDGVSETTGSSSGSSLSGGSGSSQQDDIDAFDEWNHHTGTFESIWRSFLGWLTAILFGTGIGGTLGGGLGGTVGGMTGGDPGGPDDGGTSGNGGEPPRRRWFYEDPSSVPKGWRIDKEGAITYRDPVTGKKTKFELTGYDPETGEPQYINERGLPYTESMIRENYEYRDRNSENLRQDEETGKRWAKEQREQNQDKWARERASGKTEASEAWKQEKERLKREEYLDDLAWKHGKEEGDLKGIRKDILQKEQREAQEFAYQAGRGDYFEAAETTAETIEAASDIAVDVLGEVTGPAGKTIKNAYNFAKPGLKNVAQARADGKDVYGQMEALAYGTVEGAVNVLQNEVDGIGMKVGGDTFKAGLDAYRKGEDVQAAMETAAFKSMREVSIEKGFSYLGKKASAYATAGKTQQVGKMIDSAGEGGFSFGKLAGNTKQSEALMKKAEQASELLGQIKNIEKGVKAAETFTKDVYLAANDDKLTERAEMWQALAQDGRTTMEYGRQFSELQRRKNGQ